MKRYLRSIGGKTSLFIVCVLSVCILLISIVSAELMVELDFYTQDKETVYESVVYDRMRNDIYDDVWFTIGNYKDKKVELGEDKQLVYQILNADGSVVGETGDAGSVDVWDYSFDYGVVKDGEGNISEIFYSGTQADENVEYYRANVNIKKTESAVNFYSFVDSVIDRSYSLRYGIYFIGLAALIMAIASFVALMSVAGRRNEDDGLYPGPLNTIPFDIIAGIFLSLLVLFIVSVESINHSSSDLFTVAYLAIGSFVALSLFLGLCMSLAVRIKQHSLIKGSLTYLILKNCVKLVQFVVRTTKGMIRSVVSILGEIPLVWKTVLVVSALTLIELLILVESYSDFYVAFWFMKNLVLIPLIIYIAICMKKLLKGGMSLAGGDLSYHVDTRRMFWDIKKHGENLNSIGKGMAIAVNEQMKSERMKTELITNVSHDIKTPLTSIINYADLIGKEKTSSKKIKEYTEVLLRQSERLKRLIDDLVEASKASTGNLEVSLAPCDSATFVNQAVGEYQDKFKDAELTLVTQVPDEQLTIMADGRRMWRIFDNLMNNIFKYAQKNTRVYLTLEKDDDKAVFTFKNTSREQLNISEEELMERFVRGDQSRNTEGNGLGLSIAKSMAELQNGELKVSIDGDLFKAILTFPLI
ncbi:MAG: HAMP domain-containing histidine kinase [Erysipelotrichaceae bacterium]|nr:HAMP domain-containing histidine kinase [Erysipelotrichaceae bacterium]